MPEQSSCSPAANITELWWNTEKSNILIENGFSDVGSDYELFERFAGCMDRMKGSAEAVRFNLALSRLLRRTVELTGKNCKPLWKAISEHLLLVPVTEAEFANQATAEAPEGIGPSAFPLKPFRNPCYDVGKAVFLDFDHWQDWKAFLLNDWNAAVEKGMTLLLSLPKEFSPKKTSIYHVNRMLVEKQDDPDLRLTQLAVLLFDFCRRQNHRPVVETECKVEQLLQISLHFWGNIGFPRLFWKPCNAPGKTDFSRLARAIWKDADRTKQGIAPLFCILDSSSGSPFVPSHLTLKL